MNPSRPATSWGSSNQKSGRGDGPHKRNVGGSERKEGGLEECSICCNTNPASGWGTLPCKHEFCMSCIDRLVEERFSCPICRRSFDTLADTRPAKVATEKLVRHETEEDFTSSREDMAEARARSHVQHALAAVASQHAARAVERIAPDVQQEPPAAVELSWAEIQRRNAAAAAAPLVVEDDEEEEEAEGSTNVVSRAQHSEERVDVGLTGPEANVGDIDFENAAADAAAVDQEEKEEGEGEWSLGLDIWAQQWAERVDVDLTGPESVVGYISSPNAAPAPAPAGDREREEATREEGEWSLGEDSWARRWAEEIGEEPGSRDDGTDDRNTAAAAPPMGMNGEEKREKDEKGGRSPGTNSSVEQEEATSGVDLSIPRLGEVHSAFLSPPGSPPSRDGLIPPCDNTMASGSRTHAPVERKRQRRRGTETAPVEEDSLRERERERKRKRERENLRARWREAIKGKGKARRQDRATRGAAAAGRASAPPQRSRLTAASPSVASAETSALRSLGDSLEVVGLPNLLMGDGRTHQTHASMELERERRRGVKRARAEENDRRKRQRQLELEDQQARWREAMKEKEEKEEDNDEDDSCSEREREERRGVKRTRAEEKDRRNRRRRLEAENVRARWEAAMREREEDSDEEYLQNMGGGSSYHEQGRVKRDAAAATPAATGAAADSGAAYTPTAASLMPHAFFMQFPEVTQHHGFTAMPGQVAEVPLPHASSAARACPDPPSSPRRRAAEGEAALSVDGRRASDEGGKPPSGSPSRRSSSRP